MASNCLASLQGLEVCTRLLHLDISRNVVSDAAALASCCFVQVRRSSLYLDSFFAFFDVPQRAISACHHVTSFCVCVPASSVEKAFTSVP